ncbi:MULTISPECIES: hypothetical protein [unclassified Methylobacterium]|uniref:hypothetical protein n=1 Tax=unclassified Methylobacterium TaxID=2615210 RepID=UPI000AF5B963|nr:MULTISPECIES: hypothetical protein [unclassified Methylobacterium]
MTDKEIQEVVFSVLKSRVPEAEFQGADVRSDIDFDGESIIRVTARYERRPAERREALIGAIHDLRDALIAKGEERFVFLTNQVASERQSEPDLD